MDPANSEAVVEAHRFISILNEVILFPLVTLMMGVAMVVFIWGGFLYVSNAKEPAAREKGQKTMLWGIIGFVVMVSAYAILSIAGNTIGVDADQYKNEPWREYCDERGCP